MKAKRLIQCVTGLLLIVLMQATFAQSKDTADFLVTEARKAAEKADFETAVALYRQALILDESKIEARKELSALMIQKHMHDPYSEELHLFSDFQNSKENPDNNDIHDEST